jgi:hypothetical protein
LGDDSIKNSYSFGVAVQLQFSTIFTFIQWYVRLFSSFSNNSLHFSVVVVVVNVAVAGYDHQFTEKYVSILHQVGISKALNTLNTFLIFSILSQKNTIHSINPVVLYVVH